MSDETPSEFPTYDSISQAVGATGIPKAVFQRAKKSGCPAFKSNRIAFGEFIRWHFSNDPATEMERRQQSAKTARMEELAEQEKINTAKAKESVVPKDEAKRVLSRCAVALRTKLVELPRQLALSLSLLREPSEIELKLTEGIRTILNQMFKTEWGECKCPHCGKEVK